MTHDPFGARSDLTTPLGDRIIYRIDALSGIADVDSLPYTIKVLLEAVLRQHDGRIVTDDDVKALASYDATNVAETEIAFSPGRVVLQDFTGVPAVVDLAAMREAVVRMTGDEASAQKVNPLVPCDLVIDHSVQVDAFNSGMALLINSEKEFERNQERYEFLKWGQSAFDNFRVVPPATGIVHQVNLEYLAKVVWDDGTTIYPDSLVGTDSHTTMINGIGVLGWGVGGIEAEAVMVGQPIYMLIPEVVGFRLDGKLAGRRHRHRPRAPGHPDAARARRGREVRRVPRPRSGRHAARQPGHHRQHGPRIRGHRRILPGRRADHPLHAPHRPGRGARRNRRAVLPGAGHVAGRLPLHHLQLAISSSTSPRSSPPWPARSGRRTASPCPA